MICRPTCPTASTTSTAPATTQQKKKATKPVGHALHSSKTKKYTLTSEDARILSGCALFLTLSKNHTPPHQYVSHQFQRTIKSWTETSNIAETPGHWRDFHLLAVSLIVWPKHHLQGRPLCLLTHLAEFQEYLYCPESPDKWKRVEEKFRTRWTVRARTGKILS